MSAVGTISSPATSTLPAVQTPEADTKKTSEASQPVENNESTKASGEYASQQMGERKLESSVREAEVRASLDKPGQSAPPISVDPNQSTNTPSEPPSIDGQKDITVNVDMTKQVDVKNDPGFKGLPQATQDKLLKEMTKTPEEAVKMQAVLQHGTYGQLSPEQKTKMLNVFANVPANSRLNLLPLMDRKVVVGSGDPPPTTPALLSEDNTTARKTLLDHLDTVATQKLEPQLAGRRGELLGKLVQETGRPAFNVNQGNVGTCAATTVQMHVLQHSPAEYARIISGLAGPDKSVTLADGSKMDAAQNQANRFLKTGPDPRNVTERMFQGAIQQYGDQIPKEQGGRGVNYKYDANNPDNTGMWDHQTGRAMKSLYNREFSYQPQSTAGSRGISELGGTAADKDALRAHLYGEVKSRIDSHQGPIATHVVWGGVDASGNPHGLHELLVEKVENGRVYYRNPWGSERTQGGSYTNGTALANPPRKVENQHEGIESMSEADFKKLINGATIGPPIGGN